MASQVLLLRTNWCFRLSDQICLFFVDLQSHLPKACPYVLDSNITLFLWACRVWISGASANALPLNSSHKANKVMVSPHIKSVENAPLGSLITLNLVWLESVDSFITKVFHSAVALLQPHPTKLFTTRTAQWGALTGPREEFNGLTYCCRESE